MQIRTLFLVCTCALAAMAASLGCGVLGQALMQYRLAAKIGQAVDVSSLLLAAADRLAVERPAEGDKLLIDAPADAASLAALAEVRADTDQAMETVRRRIAALAYPGSVQQLQLLGDIRGQLASLRAKADAMVVLPKRQREPGLFERYLAGFNRLFDQLDAAQDLRDIAAAQQDGVTMDLIELAREVWSVRRTLGSRSAPLMAAVDAGAPVSQQQKEAQARFDGIVAQNRATIDTLLRRLEDIPGLRAAGATADAAIGAHEELLHQVLAEGEVGDHYLISAIAVGRAAVRAGLGVLTLRDAALAAARSRVADAQQAALIRAAEVGAFVAVILAATTWILVLLRQRILIPVLALTQVIGRLAQRDYTVSIPAATEDEIGRMADALETLRQGAIATAQAEAQIAHLARHDTLTGLANRRSFQERLDLAMAAARRGEKCALLCLDLDRFKAVNDSFGHPTGDLLLQSVARRLQECVREIDTVARFGGDEFAVLLARLDKSESAALVAGRIVSSLAQPFELEGLNVQVGASVGIAVAPQDGTAAGDLLKRADTALYQVKHDEKGSFRFFAPEMQAAQQARSELEQDLRDAVRDEGFELAYQPRYSLTSDRLNGFEALLRWPHKQRGMVEPGHFIPLAEESRLMLPIGAWVLQQACAAAASWPEPLRLAVNLSAAQFRNHDLAATVREALTTSGLPAERLELEVRETVLLRDREANLAVLTLLTDMGVGIALDNFGTGNSALGFMRRFPLVRVKIDQSFIRDLAQDPRSAAIIRAMAGLGRDLGMAITGMGVETEDQLEGLRQEGCTDAQGYLLGRPLNNEQALELLASERRKEVLF